MKNDTIIGIRRGNIFFVFSIPFIVVIVTFILLHFFGVLPLNKFINPITLIPIGIFSFFSLLGFLKFVDKKPLLIIHDNGISMRRSRLPFAALEHIDWNDIKEYNTKVEQFKNGTTKFLVIKRKSNNKKYYVDLFDLKTDDADIMAALRRNLQKNK